MLKILATLTLLVPASFCAQIYPGTSSRPILSDQEAASCTAAAYFQEWTPPALSTPPTPYIVGGDGSNYSTIQEAVDAALNDGGHVRKYIKINEGTYNEIVYVPPGNSPITLYGAGSDASSTIISFNLSAFTTGSTYKELVGSLFKPHYPGYEMYSSCASKTFLGANCSSVVWAKADRVQIINLSIRNVARRSLVDQVVALYAEGDQVQVSNCRILSHQNTFWSGAFGPEFSRGHVTNTYIEGDVDFVFGGGSTVFEGCTFYVKADRDNAAVIFSPATDASHIYGYLVINGNITGDSTWFTSKDVYLARAGGPRVSLRVAYEPNVSPNGQLVLRESNIDDIIHQSAPYSAAFSERPYAGNNNTDRNLHDNHYNRFWEHANTGEGA